MEKRSGIEDSVLLKREAMIDEKPPTRHQLLQDATFKLLEGTSLESYLATHGRRSRLQGTEGTPRDSGVIVLDEHATIGATLTARHHHLPKPAPATALGFVCWWILFHVPRRMTQLAAQIAAQITIGGGLTFSSQPFRRWRSMTSSQRRSSTRPTLIIAALSPRLTSSTSSSDVRGACGQLSVF